MWRLILAGWAALGLVVLGGILGFMLYTHLALGLPLKDQPGLLQLPALLKARATATNTVAIRLHGNIDATVPFRQDLSIPLTGTYPADMALDTLVPLRFVIEYHGSIPIHSSTEIQATTDLVLHKKFLPKFPLRITVPLDFQLPVTLKVPVDTRMRFSYHGPVRFAFNQTVTVPVDTVIRARLPVDRDVNAPILASFGLSVEPPATALPIIIRQADLNLSLRSLSLGPVNAGQAARVSP